MSRKLLTSDVMPGHQTESYTRNFIPVVLWWDWCIALSTCGLRTEGTTTRPLKRATSSTDDRSDLNLMYSMCVWPGI